VKRIYSRSIHCQSRFNIGCNCADKLDQYSGFSFDQILKLVLGEGINIEDGINVVDDDLIDVFDFDFDEII